jgi:hypothetical protein
MIGPDGRRAEFDTGATTLPVCNVTALHGDDSRNANKRGSDWLIFVGIISGGIRGHMTRYSIETLAVIVGLLVAFSLSRCTDGTWLPVH